MDVRLVGEYAEVMYNFSVPRTNRINKIDKKYTLVVNNCNEKIPVPFEYLLFWLIKSNYYVVKSFICDDYKIVIEKSLHTVSGYKEDSRDDNYNEDDDMDDFYMTDSGFNDINIDNANNGNNANNANNNNNNTNSGINNINQSNHSNLLNSKHKYSTSRVINKNGILFTI